MPNRPPRVKRFQRKRLPKVPTSVKFLTLLVHFMGLLIFLLQQPEVREIVQILLKGKL
jgi:hypothetical protein